MTIRIILAVIVAAFLTYEIVTLVKVVKKKKNVDAKEKTDVSK